MKKILTLVLILLSISVLAQRGGDKRDKLDAQRSAYLSTRMGLSSEEAQKFFPVYNSYRQEIETNRRDFMSQLKTRVPIDQRSDSELKQLVEGRFKMEEKKLAIEKKYFSEFEKILTIRQISKLYQAEEEFKKEIIKEIQRR